MGFFFCFLCFLNKTQLLFLIWSRLKLRVLACFRLRTIIGFYLRFELRLIPIVLLIIILGVQPERLLASFYFLFYTIRISLPFLFSVLRFMWNYKFFYPLFLYTRLVLILILPFLVKLPIFGLHFWLPKAHVEARTRGSMVLAGLILKLGGFGLVRLYFYVVNGFNFFYKLKGLILSLVLVSRIFTFLQSDAKKIVAYRRVTHINFILISILISMKFMWVRVTLSSISHCWASMGLFGAVGLYSHNRGSRILIFLSNRLNNWFRLILFCLLCLNFSVPPFLSFFSEIFFFIRLMSVSFLVAIIVVAGIFFCYYNVKLFYLINQGKDFFKKNAGYSNLERLVVFRLVFVSTRSLYLLFFI